MGVAWEEPVVMVVALLMAAVRAMGGHRKNKENHTYRIAGNFGEVFNLANWRFYGKSPN